jgi:hypothetical protein
MTPHGGAGDEVLALLAQEREIARLELDAGHRRKRAHGTRSRRRLMN